MNKLNIFLFSVLSLIALFVTIACTSCAVKVERKIDRRALPYVISFEQTADAYHRVVDVQNLDLDFAHINSNHVGECYRPDSGQNKILIDIDYWEGLDEGQRKQLIWHELGHCWLYREHNNSLFPDGDKQSIMHEEAFAEGMLERHYAWYVYELFK